MRRIRRHVERERYKEIDEVWKKVVKEWMESKKSGRNVKERRKGGGFEDDEGVRGTEKDTRGEKVWKEG